MTEVETRLLMPAEILDHDDDPDDEWKDPEAMAAVHATGFPRGARWSAAMLIDAQSLTGAIVVREPGAFAIGRAMAGEAELHTLVVAPFLRRSGVATRLLAAFEAGARAKDAAIGFLEVAEDNHPARALYSGKGWEQAGRRRGYYAGTDALILHKRF